MNTDQLMRDMMQSMGMGMGMPFGGFFNDFPSAHPQSRSQDPLTAMMSGGGLMSPMSMMMMDPFQSMHQAMSMANNGNNSGFSYCSSSVTSYTTDQHGRPQIYQQSNEVKQGPNGLKETKASIRDSRTGHQELSIGHHLKDKAHIKKKSKNVYTGDEEQAEDFVNLAENEAESFEQNWLRQARNASASSHNQLQNGRHSRNNRLAITSGDDQHHSHHHQSTLPPQEKVKKEKKKKKDLKDLKFW